MNKAERIKKAHIKKVNELLDEGFKSSDPKERPVVLKPSDNVNNSTSEFMKTLNRLGGVNKMV